MIHIISRRNVQLCIFLYRYSNFRHFEAFHFSHYKNVTYTTNTVLCIFTVLDLMCEIYLNICITWYTQIPTKLYKDVLEPIKACIVICTTCLIQTSSMILFIDSSNMYIHNIARALYYDNCFLSILRTDCLNEKYILIGQISTAHQ